MREDECACSLIGRVCRLIQNWRERMCGSPMRFATNKSVHQSTSVSLATSQMISIQDLHVDLFLSIFAHLELRDMCTVELGM